jgi:hypothetical protein
VSIRRAVWVERCLACRAFAVGLLLLPAVGSARATSHWAVYGLERARPLSWFVAVRSRSAPSWYGASRSSHTVPSPATIRQWNRDQAKDDRTEPGSAFVSSEAHAAPAAGRSLRSRPASRTPALPEDLMRGPETPRRCQPDRGSGAKNYASAVELRLARGVRPRGWQKIGCRAAGAARVSARGERLEA